MSIEPTLINAVGAGHEQATPLSAAAVKEVPSQTCRSARVSVKASRHIYC